VTSAMESAPDQSLIIALLRGSEARFIVSDCKGCGGLFACPRNADRKEAPGFIFVRRHRTTACRQGNTPCGGIRTGNSRAQRPALKCRTDLERNNADVIVLR
jgi:hypothetical protein